MTTRTPAQYLAALGALDVDQLVGRLDQEGLTTLAAALQVPRTGTKPAVAQRILDRCHLTTRSLELGTDPQALARSHRKATLVDLAAAWGAWRHGTKHALAAGILSRRDTLLCSLAADLEEPARPGYARQRRLF